MTATKIYETAVFVVAALLAVVLDKGDFTLKICQFALGGIRNVW